MKKLKDFISEVQPYSCKAEKFGKYTVMYEMMDSYIDNRLKEYEEKERKLKEKQSGCCGSNGCCQCDGCFGCLGEWKWHFWGLCLLIP